MSFAHDVLLAMWLMPVMAVAVTLQGVCPRDATNVTVRPVDDGRALRNPGCGWVMHYYDNGAKYGTSLATGDSMSWYPSCNVVYLRLPWSWLEPEEGVYNWQAIDTPAQQWIDRGGQVAFRITVSETMRDGATPAWMLKSGAKIIRWNWVEGPKADGRFWECAPDDPIFLEKFGNFLKAFAARYDGRREVAFVDVGSLGVWGEGHTQRTIRLSEADTDRIARLHAELHLRHFRRTPVVVGDDFTIGTRKTQTSPMMDWALAQGLAWRDDSIIVGNPNDPDYPDSDWWYHEKQGRAFSEKAPVILEFGHYQTLKGWNNWNVEKLAEAVEKHRASYLSIHGNPHEILRENKEVVEALARRVGYRFQVREVVYPSLVHANPEPSKASPFAVTFAVANAGAAPCYRDLYPCLTFKTPSGGIAAVLADSGFNLKSLPVAPPGQAEAKSHTASFALGRWDAPVIQPGEYDVFLSVGEADGTPVCELPMAADDGKRRYRIGRVSVAESPRHVRRFPRTLYFSEIPLNTTYGNGNIWTGWTGRWTDWPLMTDRSIPYIEGRHYRVTWPDLLRTLSEMKLGGMDAATYNVARRENGMLIDAALARGEKLPVMTIPDYPPCKRADGYVTPDKEDEPWFAPSFFNRNGCFFEGKPIITSYWTFRTTPEQIDERCAYIRKKYGDFWFVPDVGLFSPSAWRERMHAGKSITAADIEGAKERLRTILRHADGARYCGYTAVSEVFDGERSFDPDFFRRYVKPIILEVYAEPEFKGKFLAMNVGMGHDNTYKGGQIDSSNGTKTLRDSITCALELDPDFITFFEWDEWNENTGIRPTLWNSFAARRIVRAMKAEAEGRGPEAPLEGDDTSVPNIILSFRKTLALGESLRFELLSVPDAAATGIAKLRLTLKDENGAVLAKLPEVELDLAKMDERRVKWDSALAGDACAVLPELEIEWNGNRRTWSEGLPFAEIRPSSNWDRKWVLMPLRDLIDGAKCTVSPAGFRDGTTRIRVKVDSPRTIDRLEVVDGGDIVHSMSGDERQAYREDEDHYVFSSMNFCSSYTQKGATMSIEGVSDAEWMLGTNRTHGLRRKLFPQAEFTVDTYVRVLKREATNAVLKLDWPDIGKFEMPLGRVLENGVYSIAGTNGFCMGVHRFNRQAAFFAPVNAKRAESVADIVPDLPVSVIGGHAITADGKICRSKPIVVGSKSGEKQAIRVWSEEQKMSVTVEVDRARLPRFSYDVSGKRTGTVAKSRFGWAYNGILGGSTAVATRRNRGGDSRQHCCTEKRIGMPTCAPVVTGEGRQAEMRFDGTGTYFVMPGGVIPTTCAYRFSFEFRPEDPEREQEIFGTGVGAPALWGVIGYLKLVDGGYLSGIGLSLHEYGDAHFRSKNKVRKGEWNKLELVSDVDTLEMFLNGESSGKVKLVQPGRSNSNCWFGGRPKELFKGSVRDVRVRHGW